MDIQFDLPTGNYTVSGSADDLRHFLVGPPQHDEHTKGWRWHIYCKDDEARYEAVKAELLKMRAERQARQDELKAEFDALEGV